jgi:hypothetical protein
VVKRIVVGLTLLVALPAWTQVEPSATGPPSEQDSASQMQTPPAVSGAAYSTEVGSEVKSNYLEAGLTFGTAYDDNVLPGAGAKPVGDASYSISSTLTIDQTIPRQFRTFTYSPGFTIYQRTSGLNALNQNAGLNFQYRLSPHTTIGVRDSFIQSSNVFNQPGSLLGGSISGSPPPSTSGVYAPYANTLTNSANAQLSYQFSRNGMVGGGGTFTELDYPKPSEALGLYSSNSLGGSMFYNRRLSRSQYVGVNYQYTNTQAGPVTEQSTIQTHTLLPYYSLLLNHSLSLSLSCGPDYSNIVQSSSPPSRSWTPAAMASIGWQRSRTNFAGSYSRIVEGGGGLLGAFESTSANASARWQVTRTWTVGASGGYAINKSITPLITASGLGGHSISGTAAVQHPIGEHFKAELGYTRLHETYGAISVIAQDPDSDRGYVSISYQFKRPLGR